MNRRDLLRLTPALSLALAESGLEAQEEKPLVSREQVKQALAALGLEFKDEQVDLMLPNLSRSLGNFTSLRRLRIPLDTDPAIRFDPLFAGKQLPPSGRFMPGKPGALPPWKSIDELAYWPVTQLAGLLRRRKVTSTDLTKMYLGRLKQHSPTLLCTVTLTESLALEQAARADAEIRAGRYKGPLHGIPYGAKDLFAAKGFPATWGAEPYQEQVFDYNATVIGKLEQAGAVLVAKLSMGALAMGDLWFRGRTKNPWNPEQGSSGSSAGSASATAAGLVAFSLGTETLGSIISPSTRCGVTGLRPTFGRVSRAGAMALTWTMDKIGPICRTVEDTMLVLRAIQGEDGKDLTVRNAPLAWNPTAHVKPLKVGVLTADFERLAPDRKQLLEEALAALRKAGVETREAKLPQFPTQALLIILNAEAGAAFDDLTRDGGVEKLSGQRPGDWPNSFRGARLIPAVEYIRAMRARTLLMREFDKLMSEWDVLVSPSQSGSLSLTNLTGHPQICVPCGFANGNDPVSLTFTGRLYEEGTMARVAKAFQDATDWHRRQPPLFQSR
jgi:Asp-tRNA(Asn)/Glu-tRNA(Gln) amidotransferase A subunit family amidase